MVDQALVEAVLFYSLATVLVVFAILLMSITHLFLGAAKPLLLAAVLSIVPLVFGIVGFGIGLGARHPRFRIDNAAAIATGIGGVIFMIGGVMLLLRVVGLSMYPTVVFAHCFDHGHWPRPRSGFISVLCTIPVVAVPLLLARWALKAGAKNLETLEKI